nr:hypothetical protein Q903MT_gene4821 [Picea sitchensis]
MCSRLCGSLQPSSFCLRAYPLLLRLASPILFLLSFNLLAALEAPERLLQRRSLGRASLLSRDCLLK